MKIKEAVEQYISETDSPPPQSQNAKKHGAYGYLNRTKDNQPLPMDLYLIQNEVLRDMQADGPAGSVKKQALRLSTAAELLWKHMSSDPEQFNKYLKSWGWLVNSSIRAMREYSALNKTHSNTLDLPSVMARPIKDE